MCKDAQEDQAHFDDTKRPPKRQRESLWQREAEEPRLPASAQSFQEPRLSANAQSFQDWGPLAARAKHGPPPSRPPIGLHPAIWAKQVPQASSLPTSWGPRPPSMPPPSHQHQQVPRASPPPRGGGSPRRRGSAMRSSTGTSRPPRTSPTSITADLLHQDQRPWMVRPATRAPSAAESARGIVCFLATPIAHVRRSTSGIRRCPVLRQRTRPTISKMVGPPRQSFQPVPPR